MKIMCMGNGAINTSRNKYHLYLISTMNEKSILKFQEPLTVFELKKQSIQALTLNRL